MYHSLHLQQAKVRHILRSLTFQPKLTIGQPNDKYEQEADRVADEVMRMPEPQVQRQVEPEEEEETLQPKPLVSQITPLVQVQRQEEPEEEEEEEAIQTKLADGMQVQRQEEPEEEEETPQAKPLAEDITPIVQRQVEPEEEEGIRPKSLAGAAPEITPEIGRDIQSIKGVGQPLSASERAFFEPRFGADFGNVRVHSDARTAHVARSINARAFTLGRHVVFGAGQYSPGTSSGRKLLAHELTHTLQQRNESTAKRLVGRNIGNIAVLNTSQQIQKGVVAVAGLGLAAFSTGKELATSGGLSHKSTPATYMHPGTPASAKWKQVITTLHIRAWNPRLIIGGAEHFYFRLAYEYNGYDIRNATINVLRSKSSGMYASTFDITWSPGKHSRPKDPVAQIIFNISGQWNPVGRGDYSFWGKSGKSLVISAAMNGRNFESFTIGSEKCKGVPTVRVV